MMKRLLAPTLVLLCALGCSGTEESTDTPVPPAPTSTQVPATSTPSGPPLKDINYIGRNSLDVFLPDGEAAPFPTVLVLHGQPGVKMDYHWLAERLSASGYAVVVPTWNPVRLGAANTLCSLAWTHSNAETYGFDPERIVAFGHSAGAHMAALLAAIDNQTEFLQECPYDLPESGAVKGVISYAGAFVMPEWYLRKAVHLFEEGLDQGFQIPKDEILEIRQALLSTPTDDWLNIGGLSEKASQLIRILPPAWIDGSEPPFLLIHGEEDALIDPLESAAFADLLEEKGAEVKLKLIPSAGHDLGESSPGFDETWSAMQAFLAQLSE